MALALGLPRKQLNVILTCQVSKCIYLSLWIEIKTYHTIFNVQWILVFLWIGRCTWLLYFMQWYTNIRIKFCISTSGYPSIMHVQLRFSYCGVGMILECRLYVLLRTLSDSNVFYLYALSFSKSFKCISASINCGLGNGHFGAHCVMFTKLHMGIFTAIDDCGPGILQCISSLHEEWMFLTQAVMDAKSLCSF